MTFQVIECISSFLCNRLLWKVLNWKFLQECIFNAVPQLLSCSYLSSDDLPMNDLPIDFIGSTPIYADDTTFYFTLHLLFSIVYSTLTLIRLLILATAS